MAGRKRNYPNFVCECGSTAHHARGLCCRCYNRENKRLKRGIKKPETHLKIINQLLFRYRIELEVHLASLGQTSQDDWLPNIENP